MKSSYTPRFLISYLLASVGANKELVQIKKKTAIVWDYCQHCQLCVIVKNSNLSREWIKIRYDRDTFVNFFPSNLDSSKDA